jgi:Ca-activated chloride channel homolog
MKPALLLTQISFVAVLGTLAVKSQFTSSSIGTGELQGKVIDAENNKALGYATVVIMQNGTQNAGTMTDENGNYVLKPISPGTYSIKVTYVGYNPIEITGVVISADKITFQDIKLTKSTVNTNAVIVTAEPKLIDAERTQTGATKSFGLTRSKVISPAYDMSATYQYTPSSQGTTNIYGDALETDGFFKRKGKQSDETSNEEYATIHENNFKRAFDEPLSTFSIDVDNASYSIIRRYLNANTPPPVDAVRIEELVNYFSYNYPEPKRNEPFSIITESGACPWDDQHRLIKVAIKGQSVDTKDMPSANLVFLVDVSGSMQSADKIGLVKASLKYLVNALRDEDKVALTVYAGSAGLVLPPTPCSDKQKIISAIDKLEAGGSTAGGAGIQLAYNTAKKYFIEGGNNRVILATDGDFNVGVSSASELEHLIEEKRKENIFLTVLGFGTGNYKDARMEILADKGNGNYYYVDNESEGKKIFTENLTGAIYTIAKDVKLQIEFNPAKVKAYRLVGYENRMLNKEDFNDDKKDAGELGAGICVTAFYEIIPFNSDEEPLTALVDTLKYQTVSQSFCHMSTPEAMTVKLRYKKPNEDVSSKLEVTVLDENIPFESTSSDFQFATAVAEFGLLLRNSQYKGDASFDHVFGVAKATTGNDKYREEFTDLVKQASNMKALEASNKR